MEITKATNVAGYAPTFAFAKNLICYAFLAIFISASFGCANLPFSSKQPELCNSGYLLESAKALKKMEHPPTLRRNNPGEVRHVKLGKGQSLPGAPSSTAVIDLSGNQAWLRRSDYGGGVSWYGPIPVDPNNFAACESAT
jgi:hypothetical protein